MHEIMESMGEVGIVPLIKLESADEAVPSCGPWSPGGKKSPESIRLGAGFHEASPRGDNSVSAPAAPRRGRVQT